MTLFSLPSVFFCSLKAQSDVTLTATLAKVCSARGCSVIQSVSVHSLAKNCGPATAVCCCAVNNNCIRGDLLQTSEKVEGDQVCCVVKSVGLGSWEEKLEESETVKLSSCSIADGRLQSCSIPCSAYFLSSIRSHVAWKTACTS